MLTASRDRGRSASLGSGRTKHTLTSYLQGSKLVSKDHDDSRSALKNVCPLYPQDKVSPPLCGTVLKQAAKTRNTRPHKARREESWQNLSLRTTYNSRSRQQGPGAARPLRRRNWTPPHRDLSVPRTASSLPTDLSPVSKWRARTHLLKRMLSSSLTIVDHRRVTTQCFRQQSLN